MTEPSVDDSLLRLGLEAAGVAPSNEPFEPDGLARPEAMDLLKRLLKQGLVGAPDQLVIWDGDVIATARGVIRTAEGSDALRRLQAPVASEASAYEVWSRLRKHADRHSPFAREIDDAAGDMEARGLGSSGISISRAREIAYDHQLEWDGDSQDFIPVGSGAPTLSPGQSLAVGAAGELFASIGAWPTGREVMRALARAGHEWTDDWLRLPPNVGSYHGSEVTLSAEGLHISGAVPELLDALVQFASVVADLYLGDEEAPIVTTQVMEPLVGTERCRRLPTILGSEGFLVGSGSPNADGWAFEIGPLAARFAGCETIDQYLRIRRSFRPVVPPSAGLGRPEQPVPERAMHPGVSDVVAEPLVNGRRGDAVRAAAFAVRDLLRSRTGLTTDGKDLVDQGCKQLRFFPDLEGRTADNRRAGTRMLLEGLFRDIRNTLAHDEQLLDGAEVDEIIGLCSLLARRIDRAVLVDPEGVD